MEEPAAAPARRRRLLPKFTAVALIGFTVSAVILRLGMMVGLRPWSARLIALAVAMNVTFLINGKFVFKTLTRQRFFAQWGAYVTNSAVGNFCNYWTFVTLESTHRPVIGNPYVALFAGSVVAWAINYTGARLLVFGSAGKRLASRCRQMIVNRGSRQTPSPPRPAGPPGPA